ncbi:hypothetical protein WA026_003942 [Henosepilachna vigintioctopunctata]|uniref:Uncharacterized protein n=1 Tax=Henosepilachna vigintioctopunctata TaxID=420089 RepID=A0AAW1U5X3_9CUCU
MIPGLIGPAGPVVGGGNNNKQPSRDEGLLLPESGSFGVKADVENVDFAIEREILHYGNQRAQHPYRYHYDVEQEVDRKKNDIKMAKHLEYHPGAESKRRNARTPTSPPSPVQNDGRIQRKCPKGLYSDPHSGLFHRRVTYMPRVGIGVHGGHILVTWPIYMMLFFFYVGRLRFIGTVIKILLPNEARCHDMNLCRPQDDCVFGPGPLLLITGLRTSYHIGGNLRLELERIGAHLRRIVRTSIKVSRGEFDFRECCECKTRFLRSNENNNRINTLNEYETNDK